MCTGLPFFLPFTDFFSFFFSPDRLTCKHSDYVRKYFDVKKRAFQRNYMRDFDRFYAKFLFVNHPRNNRCEIRICPENNVRFSNSMCENAHRAALTLSL